MRKIKKSILTFLHERINQKNKKRLIKKPRTIIANNCIGGFISHFLNLRFESPTINLFIRPSDYLIMLQDFDRYFNPDAEITQVETSKPYPVGNIYGCEIHFMHYKSFDEAVAKWKERARRINKESLYIFMTDRDGCQLEDLYEFDKLPYCNKVCFTHTKVGGVESAFYIKGFEHENQVGSLERTMNITGKRYIDQFDYVSFLNRE